MHVHQALQAAIKAIPDFPIPGILFRDISPVLADSDLSVKIVDALFNHYVNQDIDAVTAIESRGFLFGFPLAMKLGVPFFMVRKKGKLPGKTVSYAYALEYGHAEIEMQSGQIHKDMKVLVHDDLLATGGTAAATAFLITEQGGQIAGFNFLVELCDIGGRQKLLPFNAQVHTLHTYH